MKKIITTAITLGAAALLQAETPKLSSDDWAVFSNTTKEKISYKNFIAEIAQADIIVVGEYHDNGLGHEIEAQIAKDIIAIEPKTTIALEMFERDEQPLVDLYLDGKISAKNLETLTDSSSWGNKNNSWEMWYQPIVDIAKDNHATGANLKAANAPRHFVKLARLEGFEGLEEMLPNTNDAYTMPNPAVDDSKYKERFISSMTSRGGASSPMGKMGTMAQDLFRSQQMWDATMAASVVTEKSVTNKVILFIGDFHIAYDGGTLLRIKHDLPNSKVVSVSVNRNNDISHLAESDYDRADYIFYTPEQEQSIILQTKQATFYEVACLFKTYRFRNLSKLA